MITLGAVRSDEDLRQILELQQANLPDAISTREALEQGFLTVAHDLETLRTMNTPHAHTVAWANGRVVGYALTMTEGNAALVPILLPFFERISELTWQGQPVKDYHFVLMGQVCVAKDYRGQGVFGRLYETMQKRMAPYFDLIITEISTRNTRSLRAHAKAGFVELDRYAAPDGEKWVVVRLACR